MGVNTKRFDSASDMITFSRASGGYGFTKVGYGSELVTNGDFSDGSTGWTASSATLSVVSGRLQVVATSAYGGFNQIIPYLCCIFLRVSAPFPEFIRSCGLAVGGKPMHHG